MWVLLFIQSLFLILFILVVGTIVTFCFN
jgi:hypothetical protein